MLKIKVKDISKEILVKSWAAYHPTAKKHIQTITIPENTTGEDIEGKYFTLYSHGDATKNIVWFNNPDSVEETTVACTVDVSGSLGGKYFLLNNPSTSHYIYLSNAQKEKNTFTCDSSLNLDNTGKRVRIAMWIRDGMSDLHNGSSWHFFVVDPDDTTQEIEYYCWYNVYGGDVDPEEDGIPIEIEVSGQSGPYFAERTAEVINAANLDGIASAANNVSQVVINGSEYGAVSSAFYGPNTSDYPFYNFSTDSYPDITAGDYFTFTAGIETPVDYYVWFNLTDGDQNSEAHSIDPEVSNATGIQVDLLQTDTTGTLVAAKVRTALSSVENITVSGSGADVVIENDEYGEGVAMTSDIGGSFASTRTTTGVDDPTDPEPLEEEGVIVRVDPDSSNSTVATAVKNAIDELGDYSATVSDNVVTISTIVVGEVIDAADGDTGFTLEVTVQGNIDDPQTTDPNLLFIDSVQVDVDLLDDNDTIATSLNAVIDNLTDFTSSVTDNIITVTNASNGECTTGFNETTSLEFAATQIGSSGPIPGTTEGDWINIIGKIKDDTLIDNEEHPDKYKPINICIPIINILSITDTDA